MNNHSALQAAAALGLDVIFERGHATDISDPNRSYIPATAAVAKAADVAVMFIGLSTLGKACEGEEHDRASTSSRAQEHCWRQYCARSRRQW